MGCNGGSSTLPAPTGEVQRVTGALTADSTSKDQTLATSYASHAAALRQIAADQRLKAASETQIVAAAAAQSQAAADLAVAGTSDGAATVSRPAGPLTKSARAVAISGPTVELQAGVDRLASAAALADRLAGYAQKAADLHQARAATATARTSVAVAGAHAGAVK
jgi:hypothetical protein